MKHYKKAFLLSLAINSTLPLLLGVMLAKEVTQEKSSDEMIKAFIYRASSIPTQVKVAHKKALPVTNKATPSKPNTTAAGISKQNQTIPALLKLLHAALAAQQIYPEQALELHQKGRVKIGFDINPAGELSHIVLLQSSGYTSIDMAALAAAQAISPFPNSKAYLHTKQTFSVDVVFA